MLQHFSSLKISSFNHANFVDNLKLNVLIGFSNFLILIGLSPSLADTTIQAPPAEGDIKHFMIELGAIF